MGPVSSRNFVSVTSEERNQYHNEGMTQRDGIYSDSVSDGEVGIWQGSRYPSKQCPMRRADECERGHQANAEAGTSFQ
jgi:hypothetical protein